MSIWFSQKMSWLNWLIALILVLNSIGVGADLLRYMPQPARAVDPNMIVFWDTGSGTIPTGWTCISDGGGEYFYQRYVRASGTYGAQGGAASHTHTLAYVADPLTAPAGNNGDAGTTPVAAQGDHAHGALANQSIVADDNLPAYNALKVLEYDSGIPASLPSGVILLFETADTATNWQLYAAQNGRFIRGDATTATGGNSTPTHAVASGLGATNSTQMGNSAAGAMATMTHTHTAGASTNTDNPSIEPPYREVVFQQTTAETALRADMIAGFTGTGVPAAWTVVSDSGGTYYQKFIKSNQGGSLTSGGISTHSHANVTVTSGNPTPTAGVDVAPSNRRAFAASNHTHDIEISLQADVDHTPLYTDLVLAQYDPSYTPKMNNWRWYGDEADAAVDTPYAAENTALPTDEIGKSIAMKLRINLTEIGGVAENDSRKILQYSLDPGGPWSAVSAIGTTSLGTRWRFYDGGGTDGATLPSKVLSDSSAVSLGTHNEASSTGQTNSDHPASTTVEWEFCLENYDATASTTYYFNLKDEVLTTDIPLADGKDYPSLTTASYDLSVSASTDIDFGSHQIGSSVYHEYNFTSGELVTVRDNRGQTSGDSSGWSLTADMSTELNCCPGGTLGSIIFTGTGLDDMSHNNTYTGCSGVTFVITVTNVVASPDRFNWSVDGQEVGTGINMSTDWIELSDGAAIKFDAVDGHTIMDLWTFSSVPGSQVTILDDDTYWISDSITGLYAAPTTNISTQAGDYMDAPVTVASVSGNAKDGLGGFTLQPTMRLYNLSTAGSYTGVITFTLT